MSLSVAGCTNSYSAPDYTVYLEKYYGENSIRLSASTNSTVTVTKPLSRTGDRAYAGEYMATERDFVTTTYKTQIEPLTSKGAAVARYEQLKREKVNSGWTITPPSGYNLPVEDSESTILQKHDESYSVGEGFIVSYSNDTKINGWLVYSMYIKNDFKI